MNTVPVVHLSAFAHRQWYVPGDVVRVQLYVACAREVDSSVKNLFAPPPAAPLHNYFNADDAAECSEADSDVCVYSVRAALAAQCRANPSVLDYDWNEELRAMTLPITDEAAMALELTGGTPNEGTPDCHELFSSPWGSVVSEDVHLRARQCRSYTFSFRLPANLPPTLTMEEMMTMLEVRLVATWQPRRSKLSRDHAVRTPLSVPIPVYNAACAISHFSFAAAFPLSPDSPLCRTHFEFLSMPLPSVPTAAVSAPLEDSLYPSESQMNTAQSSLRETLMERQNTLAEMKEPVRVSIPVGDAPVALEAQLVSSFVSIGDSVRGALVDVTDPSGTDPNAPVLVRASGALEMLECCPVPVAAEGVPYHAVYGVDGVAMLHTHVESVQEWVLLDAPCVAFSFPLQRERVQPTVLTDVGILLWQLRIKVQWTTRAHLAKSREKGAEVLAMCTSGPELVIPLTILPPRAPQRPRRGQVYSTFF